LRIAKGGKNKYPRTFFIIHSAIAKYGANNFEFSCIQEFVSEQLAYDAEKYWIDFYNTRDDKFGYNITAGGIGSGSGTESPNFGLKRSEITIAKLRESHLGEKNSNYGRTLSENVRQNMSKAQKNNFASATLNWGKVDTIRSLYKSGTSQRELSKMFGVTQSNISNIVNNKTWIK
jgi:group I intron endonuclease